MKKQNNIYWKEGSDTPQKKRAKSLNEIVMPSKKTKQKPIPKTFSNIKKLLSLESEDDKSKTTNVTDVSSIPDNECFSELNFNIKVIVEKITKTEESLILECKKHRVILLNDWMDLTIHKGMSISIYECPCCSKDAEIHDTDIIVDGTNHLLIIDDDILPVTTYLEAFNCLYRPILKENVLDVSFHYSHSSMAVGVIIHSVIESCLKENNYTLKFIVDKMKIEIAKHTSLLYSCDLSSKNAMIDCTKFIKNIMKLGQQECFTKCYAVEKKILSHRYNMRGNIDAILLDSTAQIPLEIKTGKRVDFKHYAQIIMYMLMMSDRNTDKIQYGLLCYINEGIIKRVGLKHSEVMPLCILRNEIASIKYEIKQKMNTDRNFVKFPNQFKPTCRCDDTQYCKAIQHLFLLDGFKGEFLRQQWIAINEEEECQRNSEFYECIFVDQKDAKLVLDVQIQDINNIKEFLEIYDTNRNRICFAKMEKIENTRIFLTLNTTYNLLCYYNLYICNTKNELFYKTMRFSLLNIAIASPVFDFDISSGQNKKKEYNCMNSSAEKYLEFLTQLELENQPVTNVEIIPGPFKQEFFDLNDDQRSALFLALNCSKYHLIHGFPGTGKSHLIRLLIKILCYTKRKVLLICYTNLALDNILENLPVKHYRALKEKERFSDTESMKKYFESIELVVGTCFSFTDVIFLQRRFDFAIVDEASQQHFLLTLIPISLSTRFLLVGDHLQLKPLSVKNHTLQLSLFEHLIGTQKSELKMQYRMPDNIMKLSNQMFYNNKMRGTGKKGTLEFIDIDSDYKTTILDIVNQYKKDANSPPLSGDDGLKNIIEKIMTQRQIKKENSNSCIKKDQLTIMCYFNSAVSHIRALTANIVNVETIDRFQGSEANSIIVVFEPIIDCEIMNSTERLNVALTRCKERLILIGNSKKMREINILKELLENLN